MADVNYLAVIAATFVAAFLGGMWYSPALFAKAWMKANGYTPEKMAAMKQARSPAIAIAISVLCNLIVALVLAMLAGVLGIANWTEGLGLGLLIWVGFAVPFGLTANMFSDKSLMAFVIDAAYQLCFLALMGIIIGAWR